MYPYICRMDINIEIDKKAVMAEVYKITGYTGAKSGDMDKISSSEDELNILNSYYDDSMSAMADIISRVGYLLNEHSFCLSLPSNWKEKVKSALEKSMKQYSINYICMQWFNLSKKDEVKYYGDICDELALSIKKYLLERERPSRQ